MPIKCSETTTSTKFSEYVTSEEIESRLKKLQIVVKNLKETPSIVISEEL